MSDLASLMALLRGLHLAAMLSLLGAAAFIVWLLPTMEASPPALRRRLHRLCRLSGSVALLAGTAWFMLQTAAIADADTWSALLDALPVVAVHTHYGRIMLVRLLLLVLVAACLARRETSRGLYRILALSAVALGLQGLVGHAGATAGVSGHELVFSEALHLLAAGLWLGALLPLWLSVRVLPLAQAAALCERFTPMGLACVLVLAGTGFAQGMALVGSLPGLFGTAYGHLALLKISLFLIVLVLALLNRLWLADRLAAGRMEARRHLMLSIAVETGMGLAIVGAAALMASTTPAIEATPVSPFPWSFPWRFSVDGMTADLGVRGATIIGAGLIGGAVVLLWKRFLLALLVLTSAAMLRSTSPGLPAAEAYPVITKTSADGFAAVANLHTKRPVRNDRIASSCNRFTFDFISPRRQS
jgi:putative copper export protein